MDSLVNAAARALAVGDALGALNRVALRDDPPALALRGIAMAQLGEYPLSRELLKRAARGFGAREPLARARCLVADAEVALALRDVTGSPKPLAAAADLLASRGDAFNAGQARLIAVRRLLLLGRLDEAATALGRLDVTALPTMRLAIAELASAEIEARMLRAAPAKEALARATDAAARSGVPALQAEVAAAREALDRPVARVRGESLRLAEVESLFASGALVVDACRRTVRRGSIAVSLARRPILFALVEALAAAWPGDADRDALIARAFRTHRPDETHRARLRVEIGRLRAVIAAFSKVEATARGFALVAGDARDVAVLVPPIDGESAALLALLADGAAWSTSALALALGTSQRTVQRALVDLEAEGRVRAIGRARAWRWLAPSTAAEFTTHLLLPASLSLP